MCRAGTVVDINLSSTIGPHLEPDQTSGAVAVESNHRYYARRAAEERTAAQRSMTAAAREWHAKLAMQFAARASAALEETASAA
ncbi:hypothetical protein GCM10022281_26000 [Sphingomonas rosea]|uniref:Uncharacterized protein n=1 Tax=Sphingomonas rosea TaxID=335605 RepID=A0ABP7UHQ6_9SPHN